MNKAFIREPDQTADYCPRCGSIGESVGGETLKSFLSDDQRRTIAEPANFCPAPACEVVYFDSFERIVLTKDLLRPAYPKDPAAPICGCLGLTWDDIEGDARESVRTRVQAALKMAKSPEARCRQTMPNGRPCIGLVQKCFVQSLGGQ